MGVYLTPMIVVEWCLEQTLVFMLITMSLSRHSHIFSNLGTGPLAT